MVLSFTRSGKAFKAVMISKIPYKKNKKNVLVNKVFEVIEDSNNISDDINNESSIKNNLNNINNNDVRKDGNLHEDGDDNRNNNTINDNRDDHSRKGHKQDVVERVLNFNNEEEYSACRLLLDAANTLPPLSSFSYEIESLSDSDFEIDNDNNDICFSKVTDNVFDYDDKYIEQDYDHAALRDSSTYYDTIKALSLLQNKDNDNHITDDINNHHDDHNVDPTAITYHDKQSYDVINIRKLEKTPQVAATNYSIVTVVPHNNNTSDKNMMSSSNDYNDDDNNNNNNNYDNNEYNNNTDDYNDKNNYNYNYNSGTNKKELTERQILQIQQNKEDALVKLKMKQNKQNAILKLQSKNKIRISSSINQNIDHQNHYHHNDNKFDVSNNNTMINMCSNTINTSTKVKVQDHKIMLPPSSSSSLITNNTGSTSHELTESQLIKIDNNRRAALLKLQMIQGKGRMI